MLDSIILFEFLPSGLEKFTCLKLLTLTDKYFCVLQSNLLHAWDGLVKLQHSVLQKKLELQHGKLEMKLNHILQSQVSKNSHFMTITFTLIVSKPNAIQFDVQCVRSSKQNFNFVNSYIGISALA